MSFRFRIGRDDATKVVGDIHARLSSPNRTAMMKNLGVRGEQVLKRWWERRDAETPNKHGWPRQHFWSRIAKRTAFDPSRTTESSATVVVADPALAAKINGAVIKPTEGRKFLSIPLQARAYGDQPRSGRIPGLFVWRRAGDLNGSSPAFLATRENGKLQFWWRLVPQATVPKDPLALPPTNELGEALAETAVSFFRRLGGTV